MQVVPKLDLLCEGHKTLPQRLVNKEETMDYECNLSDIFHFF